MTDAMTHHPRHQLVEVFNNPIRLSIAAALSREDKVEFQELAKQLELTAPTLSKSNTQLEKDGYIKVKKGYVGKRPRTWLSLTKEGQAALEQHLAALRSIAGVN